MGTVPLHRGLGICCHLHHITFPSLGGIWVGWGWCPGLMWTCVPMKQTVVKNVACFAGDGQPGCEVCARWSERRMWNLCSSEASAWVMWVPTLPACVWSDLFPRYAKMPCQNTYPRRDSEGHKVVRKTPKKRNRNFLYLEILGAYFEFHRNRHHRLVEMTSRYMERGAERKTSREEARWNLRECRILCCSSRFLYNVGIKSEKCFYRMRVGFKLLWTFQI